MPSRAPRPGGWVVREDGASDRENGEQSGRSTSPRANAVVAKGKRGPTPHYAGSDRKLNREEAPPEERTCRVRQEFRKNHEPTPRPTPYVRNLARCLLRPRPLVTLRLCGTECSFTSHPAEEALLNSVCVQTSLPVTPDIPDGREQAAVCSGCGVDLCRRPALLWADMTPEQLHRLARIGAEARLGELQREMQTIHAAFPDLRRSVSAEGSTAARVRKNGSAPQPAGKPRRRPKMSAEARQRIGEAQRRRWAEWKAKQGRSDSVDGASADGGARKKK